MGNMSHCRRAGALADGKAGEHGGGTLVSKRSKKGRMRDETESDVIEVSL